jgi:outer membrane protein assembly factor BamB
MKKTMSCLLLCMLLISMVTSAVDLNKDFFKTRIAPQKSSDDIDWWPMFGHDAQHTGCSTSLAPNTNKLKWSYDTGSTIRFSSSVVVDNTLYIGTEEIGSLHSMDFEELTSKPVLDVFRDPQEVLPQETGGFFSIDANTGIKNWDFVTEGVVASTPVVYNEYVYLLSCDSNTFEGELYCLLAETGEQQWNVSCTSFLTSPVIENDNLYITLVDPMTGCGNLVCLNPINGVEKWNHSMGYNTFSMYAAPTVYNGMVYYTAVRATDVELHCVDAASGQLEWAAPLTTMELGFVISTPVLNENKLFVMSLEGYYANQSVWSDLICLDAQNGDELWRYVMQELDISLSTPAVMNDIVYFSYVQNYWEYGGIACVDTTNGSLIWDHRSSDAFFTFSSPALADEKLYIAAMNESSFSSVLQCYDLSSGKYLWSYAIDELSMVDTSPAIADEKVFIASPYGTIFAFEDELRIGEIKGGLGCAKIELQNIGDNDLRNVEWSIVVMGGLFDLINVSKNETIAILEAHTSDTVRAFPVFGLGSIEVTVTVTMEEITPLSQKKDGFVFGPFVFITDGT